MESQVGVKMDVDIVLVDCWSMTPTRKISPLEIDKPEHRMQFTPKGFTSNEMPYRIFPTVAKLRETVGTTESPVSTPLIVT